jgi:S-DNA-T family DNA segregation ATPase FtsK/SpoIIIE
LHHYKDYAPEVGLYDDMSSPRGLILPENTGGNKDSSGNGEPGGNRRRRSGGKLPESDDDVDPGKKPSKRRKSNADNSDGFGETVKSVVAFFTGATFRVLVGLFFFGLAAYIFVSLISFVSSGMVDQSEVEYMAAGTAKGVSNLGGEGGARLAKTLVNDTFGVGSVIIVFWLFMISMKLITNSHFGKFKVINFTIKCIVALVTTSLIVGLLTIGLDLPFNLGGAHGRFVNQEIIDFIGWIGAAILSIFMLAVFVGICLNDVVKWVLKKKHERDLRKAEEAALREEEEEKERKIQEMRRREEMEGALAGENSMPYSDAAQEDPSNVSFGRAAANQTNEPYTPVEEDLTYVYDGPAAQEEPADSAAEYNAEEDVSPVQSSDAVTDVKESEDVVVPSNDGAAADGMVSDGAAAEVADAAENLHGGAQPMTVNLNHIATMDDSEMKKFVDVIDPRQELPDYKFPPLSILKPASEPVTLDHNEQLENQAKIRKTLLDFGIPIVSIEATVGPTVTLYEIVPEDGVKIARIRNLGDDIALSLSAIGVRIIAPMPGRGTIGIEVPNKDPQIVSMRTILASRRYQETKYDLPLAIGSTISNQVYICDLAKMPHLLVAGATGQGKSVGLNAIIASLLYKKHPAELKFVLVDPKRVELSLYSVLEKHYLAKMPGENKAIITDMSKVVATLSSLCVEMEERYALMEYANTRNLREYNEKFLNRKLSPADGHRFMPYIVLIVDEFADLMMTVGKEVEKPIARLAQKARAIGIHLIIATQRPSTDVITGIIKANFPARIAFKVTSGVDSKTILDNTAAHQLIGRGDMLISNGSDLERVQCAFIDTPEIENICAFISQEPGFDKPYILPEPLTNDSDDMGSEGFVGERDPLFEEVARSIINMDTASTSALQRRYSIGYNRAGKIMDQLEMAGIVGPAHGGKPRDVLVDPMTLESILASL